MKKHEGPETWEWELRLRSYPADDIIYQLEPDFDPVAARPEFMQIDRHWVLLPVSRNHHAHITILHHFLSEDQAKLVIYLQDTAPVDRTYDDDLFGSGYVTICDRQPEGFYLTTLYHEWFIIDYDSAAKSLPGT